MMEPPARKATGPDASPPGAAPPPPVRIIYYSRAAAPSRAAGKPERPLKDGSAEKNQCELRGRPGDGEADPQQVIADRCLKPLSAGRPEHQHGRYMEHPETAEDRRPKTKRPGLAHSASGRSSGKSSTSRIDGWLHNSMTRRSTPSPKPAAGGMP